MYLHDKESYFENIHQTDTKTFRRPTSDEMLSALHGLITRLSTDEGGSEDVEDNTDNCKNDVTCTNATELTAKQKLALKIKKAIKVTKPAGVQNKTRALTVC